MSELSMNDDDALIELLNGFGAGSTSRNFDTEVFLDEDGMPTDRFLQALKSDMSMLPTAFDDKDHNDAIYDEKITHQLDREFSPDRANNSRNRYTSSKNRFSNTSSNRTGNSRESKENHNGQFEDYADFQFSGDEVDLSMLRGNQSGTSNNNRRTNSTKDVNLSASFKKLITDDPYFDKVKQKRKVQFNQESSAGKLKNTDGFVSSAPYSTSQRNTTTSAGREEQVKQKKKKSPNSSTKATATKTPTYMADLRSGATATGAATSSSPAGATTADEIHFPRAVGIDTTEIEVEAESRVKSLQLRLQGQLQTIRSLEAQLGDALQLLEARNKQLAHCNARLKANASAAAHNGGNSSNNSGGGNSGGNGQQGGNLRSEATAAKATELAEQYKVQADFLQAKLTEEQGRRQRAEERARVLKNYSEKAKERCLALEGQNAELRGALTEVTSRMEKYRKSYKDIASESAAQKNELSAKEEEAAKVKRQLDKTESAVRNLQMSLEHSREELRTQKVETSAAQSRYKQLALQVEIQNEKDATKRAEERLRCMESARKGNSSSNAGDSRNDLHLHNSHRQPRNQHQSGSNSPQRSHNIHSNATTTTAEQQLQYLQHLASVSAHNTRLSPERGATTSHSRPPPPVPHYAFPITRGHSNSADFSHGPGMGIHGGGGGGGGSGGACDESVRSFIEHEEDNLDRDVVMEFLQMPLPLPLPMPHQDRPPRNPSVDRAVPQLSQHLPPQHQDPHQKQQRSQKSHLVNAVLRNSFSDFESAASVSTGAGAHSSVSGSKASKTHSFASMSDSELEHPDRRQRNSYGNVNGSGVSENHSPSSGASSFAVSFIRQKVISSSGYSPVAGAAIGRSCSTSVGASDANQSSNFPQPARSSHVPSAHSLYSGNGQGGGIASESGAAANKANTSPASVGDMPLNRLQALYERVTNKTT